ncbi:MAG: thioredoxin domain-containing protein [Candidatus Nitrospinota bacterium M3_3B_026]
MTRLAIPLALAALFAACAPAQDPVEEKKRIEAVVREYIRSHPEEIADSLTKHAMAQRARKEKERIKQALRNRFDVPLDGSPATGPEAAAVTIVEFSDFQCPYCARADKTLRRLKGEKEGDIRMVFKHLPLDSVHPQARPAAMAAMAAGEQGRFWEYRDILFERQNQWASGEAEKKFVEYAGELGLDAEKFRADLSKDEYRERIEKDMELAKKLGARATPTFFVNGVRVEGAMDLDYFNKLIDLLLSEKGDGETG